MCVSHDFTQDFSKTFDSDWLHLSKPKNWNIREHDFVNVLLRVNTSNFLKLKLTFFSGSFFFASKKKHLSNHLVYIFECKREINRVSDDTVLRNDELIIV